MIKVLLLLCLFMGCSTVEKTVKTIHVSEINMLKEQNRLLEKVGVYLDSSLMARQNDDYHQAFCYLIKVHFATDSAYNNLWEYYDANN